MKINRQKLQSDYARQSVEFDKELLTIDIRDKNEPLVYLPDQLKGKQVKFAPGCSPYLRQSVAKALLVAVKEFNDRGFTLHVKSAYRSLTDQKNRFEARYQSIKAQNPRLKQAEIIERANTYTAGIPALAAHTGGAAVDVVLTGPDGRLLDFGAPYRHGDIESITDFPELSKQVKLNRQLLKEVMEAAGFSNYPFEYWHYSLGDVCAAYLKGQDSAVYGPLYFDPSTKQQSILEKDLAYKSFIGSK